MKSLVYTFLKICCLSTFSLSLHAQSENNLSYQIGYYGNNGWNPGVIIGSDYLLKERASNQKQGLFFRNYLTGNIGMYVDPDSYTAAFIQGGISIRHFYPKQHFYSLGIKPIGIYRSFLPETYSVSSQGQVEQVFLPGRWYYSPTISLGFGRRVNALPLSWFVGLDIMFLMPYNTYVLPLINISAGCRFGFKR